MYFCYFLITGNQFPIFALSLLSPRLKNTLKNSFLILLFQNNLCVFRLGRFVGFLVELRNQTDKLPYFWSMITLSVMNGSTMITIDTQVEEVSRWGYLSSGFWIQKALEPSRFWILKALDPLDSEFWRFWSLLDSEGSEALYIDFEFLVFQCSAILQYLPFQLFLVFQCTFTFFSFMSTYYFLEKYIKNSSINQNFKFLLTIYFVRSFLNGTVFLVAAVSFIEFFSSYFFFKFSVLILLSSVHGDF